uniref:Uncharacterized protein n=1 Tax=Leersia perrieri TaxID=77586 RepID=A0A0D9UX57_9ORYZ
MDTNVGNSTTTSSKRTCPLADITNITPAKTNEKHDSAIDNNAEGSTLKTTLREGHFADITNLNAAELKKKRARERYALLTVDQNKDIVQKNRENRRQRNDESTYGSSYHAVTLYPCLLPTRNSRWSSIDDVRSGQHHEVKGRLQDIHRAACVPP